MTLTCVSITTNGESADSTFFLSVISIVGGFVVSVTTIFLTSRQERIKSKEDARREYEYEARKRLYREYEPVLFQLHQLCEVARTRISHMPQGMKDKHFLTEDDYEIEKNL
jgi:hypothetical protein